MRIASNATTSLILNATYNGVTKLIVNSYRSRHKQNDKSRAQGTWGIKLGENQIKMAFEKKQQWLLMLLT